MHQIVKGKFSALLLLVTALSVQTQSATAQADNWGGGWHDGWGWGHMLFGSFMMLLFWGGLVILLVLAVRWIGAGSPRGSDERVPESRALGLLEERFARGEIEKEEFEERKRLLSK
jgi:putative membrane protein